MLRFGLLVAAAVIIVDQLTKFLAEIGLVPYQPVPLLPFFNLTLSYNRGAAFSLLADQGGWQRWLLIGVAICVCAFLLRWLAQLRRRERWLALVLGLILGGALGNAIGRLRYGYVIDFIDVHYGHWHWPAFNIADSAITLGVAWLVVSLLLEGRWRQRT
ncbi:MAG: signal peptidase II [Nitrococcus sp.]|nr:signal peptidase II [Nitrococcus sp.]